MIIESLVPALFVAAFLGLVLFAAASDIGSMTIPNWVSIVLTLAFPVAAFSAQMSWAEIGLHAGVGVLVFLAGFALFAIGVLGGGDVKVIAAVSVWTGVSALSPFAFWTTAAGGVLALALLLARKVAAPGETRPAFLNRLLDPARGIPYAVAIAFGAIASLSRQPVVEAAFR
ncbi:MAG: prepilin peptidase [Hyphomonadaceae bacterium]|nr:MAG: prepilin peptidase CpaA [Caulobacteraceae bacterium]MBT9447007.1 prepilin peptidase [Hyphomonadaceae bacterium]TPW08816.1 MAG: prepilin peptidase CpaA [Alphaproteobacteria bacterium]